jgi:hypothetical protein
MNFIYSTIYLWSGSLASTGTPYSRGNHGLSSYDISDCLHS